MAQLCSGAAAMVASPTLSKYQQRQLIQREVGKGKELSVAQSDATGDIVEPLSMAEDPAAADTDNFPADGLADGRGNSAFEICGEGIFDSAAASLRAISADKLLRPAVISAGGLMSLAQLSGCDWGARMGWGWRRGYDVQGGGQTAEARMMVSSQAALDVAAALSKLCGGRHLVVCDANAFFADVDIRQVGVLVQAATLTEEGKASRQPAI
jgi:hypothetical protein